MSRCFAGHEEYWVQEISRWWAFRCRGKRAVAGISRWTRPVGPQVRRRTPAHPLVNIPPSNMSFPFPAALGNIPGPCYVIGRGLATKLGSRAGRSGVVETAAGRGLATKDTPAPSPRRVTLRGLGESLAYSGQDRFGGIPALPNVQLRVRAVGRSPSAVLKNCKDRSTDDQTTEYGNDNHGFD